MESSVQTEIRKARPLLNSEGYLTEPGYCKRNYLIYNKENVKERKWRIKEWDYYMISDGRYLIELNFYNISVFAALTASLMDLETGRQYDDFIIEPSYPGKYKMSRAADKPFRFLYKNLDREAIFLTGNNTNRLFFKGKYKGKIFEIAAEGKRKKDQESLTSLTAFKEKHCFFYTQKLNCISAEVMVKIADKSIRLDPAKTFMTVDWGRGIWPHKCMWYWSNGSSYINGKLFGFELTWGFGSESSPPQTAVFYDGKCHKIGAVGIEKDPETEGWMKPWHFISEDGRLDLTLEPVKYRSNGFIFMDLLGMRSNQVFGKFNGYVILDDGSRIEVKDIFAFAEKVHNRW